MSAWVTDEQKASFSLDFRFHVSMAGALGIGGNLLTWSEEERARAAQHVALYKELRPLVAGGDLYRLLSPGEGPVSALAYVARDKSQAVVFAYRLRAERFTENPVLRIAGLDPDALYTLEGEGTSRSGRAWAEAGMVLSLRDDESTILRLVRKGATQS
jgi:alpha-galactosidase